MTGQKYNQFIQWVKWRWFMFLNFIERLLLLGKYASDDVKDGKQDATITRITDGGPTARENKKAKRFYEFYNAIDHSAFSRQDVYAWMLIFAVVVLATRSIFTLSQLWDNAALYTAIAVITMAVLGYIVALLMKTSDKTPVSAQEYRGEKRFLHKLGETSRKPMSFWLMLLVFLMVFVDAAMITVVVMDYMADLPRKWVIFAGPLAGLIFAAILAFLDHAAGAAWYREHKRQDLHRVIMDEKGPDGANNGADHTHTILREKINLFDTAERGFWRTYFSFVFAIVLMVIVVAGAFQARYSLNIASIHDQFVEVTEGTAKTAETQLIPKGVIEDQVRAVRDSATESEGDKKKAMIAALIILAMIFIAIQVVAMMVGYRHAFYCEESAQAYERVRQYEQEQLGEKTDGLIVTGSHQMIINAADSLYAAYHPVLERKAHAQGASALKTALAKRTAYKFACYIKAQEKS